MKDDQLRAYAVATGLEPDVLAEHVRRVVDTFPPLSAEQRDRIAALLSEPAARAAPA